MSAAPSAETSALEETTTLRPSRSAWHCMSRREAVALPGPQPR